MRTANFSYGTRTGLGSVAYAIYTVKQNASEDQLGRKGVRKGKSCHDIVMHREGTSLGFVGSDEPAQ